MEKCFAPSDIFVKGTLEAAVFGALAEDLIYMDFCKKFPPKLLDIYLDQNNESAYVRFLAMHNPSFNIHIQKRFYEILRSEPTLKVYRPDILVHSRKEFYEIKPNSPSGQVKGITKVGNLSATYVHFKLPYRPGTAYTPMKLLVASYAGQIKVRFKAWLMGPGLIVYSVCIEYNEKADLRSLAPLLFFVLIKMNEQKGKKTFRPIDLGPAFAKEGQLSSLARTLGIVMVSGVAAAVVVGWRHFWKAVVVRFAPKAALAAFLVGCDGPLPIGDLIGAGMSLIMVVDVIRYSKEIWEEARTIALEEA